MTGDDRVFVVTKNRNIETKFLNTCNNGIYGMVVDTRVVIPRPQLFNINLRYLQNTFPAYWFFRDW